ncbi:ABC transporter ATP-binding protein [Streptococcus himalayensis]|uniref:ABC-type quaternary amine transporter n=1 Tax=Streptococcus himalayensis TaxID=1888195 RepID=A0A917EG87_9STRE|nr:ABC transporter ATP-binding protein [Streptococcus himalayensis]GGE30221.1 glycine/betaine ABC transporter ATP-binding protein [Streptococcus himalayensis]
MTQELLTFEGVGKSYGDLTILSDLSFSLFKGEFITILGTSGSGKTTTLKLMNRLLEPDSGKIMLEGQPLAEKDPVALRRQIGYVVQQIGLFPHLTVRDNIATVPKLLGWDNARINQRVEELLTMVQLPGVDFAHRYPKELSGGQQQRIGVARALAANPKMVLFDEPFGAVDAITRHHLQEQLKNLHRSLGDKTFVLITHDIHEALYLGDRVMVMDKGRLVQFDRPEEIVSSPKTDFVKSLLATVNRQEKLLGGMT